MLTALKGYTIAGIDQKAVINLASVTGDITTENLIPHLEEDFIHAKWVVLGNLFCSIKRDPGQGLHHITLEQDVVRLFTIIKPPLDPQIIDEPGLDLVYRTVILA